MGANFRTWKSETAFPATLPSYSSAVKPASAPANISPRFRALPDVRRLFQAIVLFYLLFVGVFAGRLLADALLAAWLQTLLVLSAFGGVIWYIIRDLRRAFRQAEARRRRIAEACEDVARVGVAFRGEDLL